MSNDELFQALGMFQQGLQRVSIGNAIQDATQKVEQIRGMQLEGAKQQAELNAVSQGLTARLAGLGASAEQTQNVAGAFGLSVPQQAQLDQHQGDKNLQYKMHQETLASHEKIAQMGANSRQNKSTLALEKEMRGAVQKYQGNFTKDSAKIRSGVMAADKAISILNSNSPVGDASVKTAFARLGGEVGNLSEYEQKVYEGNPALYQRMKQMATTLSQGKMTESNRKEMKALAQTYKQSLLDTINLDAEFHAGHLSENYNIPRDHALRLIKGGLDFNFSTERQATPGKSGTGSPGGASGSFTLPPGFKKIN
jgi:hypothetical protein